MMENKRRIKKVNKEKGFTLVEVLVSAAIGVMILVAVLTVFTQGDAIFQQEITLLDLQQDVRRAMDGMTREIRQAFPTGNVGIGTSNITFTMVDDTNYVTYSLSGNEIIREYPAIADKILARNINALTFLQGGAGNRVITIGVNATQTDNKGRLLQYSLSEKVRLRNE